MTLSLLLPLISSIFTYLSMPPCSASYLVWFAYIPYFFAIDYAKRPVIAGLTFGVTSWLLVANWFLTGLINIGGLGYLEASGLTFLQAIIGSIPYVLFGILINCRRIIDISHNSILFSVILTSLIYFSPNTFPGNPAHALFKDRYLAQAADIGGVPLLLFLVITFNRSIYIALRTYFSVRRISLFNAALAPSILICLLSYGALSVSKWEKVNKESRKVKLALIQPNLPIKGSSREDLEKLVNLTKEAVRNNSGIDLVVWPEIPLSFSIHNQPRDYEIIRKLLAEIKIPMFISAFQYDANNPGSRLQFYNAVHLISGDIESRQNYFKNKLIPFGEYLPLEEQLPMLKDIFPDVRRYVAGKETNVLEIEKAKIAPAICLEAIYADLIRKFYANGAEIIINPSDDAYFGNSSGSMVHFALGAFRSIEYRIPLVRVNNSGITEVIDASGKMLINERELFKEKYWVLEVPIPPKESRQ